MRWILLAGILALLPPVSAHAATHVVLPNGTGDYPTIQAAIANSSWGDSVALADGVYSGPGNRDIVYQGKPITVYSLSGDPAACILDCEGSALDPHRGFLFNWSESENSILQGVTIINGHVVGPDPPDPTGCGGGILVINGSGPTIRNVVVRDCYAMMGGGVFVWEGSPRFSDCTFSENDSWWGSGGGAYSHSSPVRFVDCRFIDNQSNQSGGGLACNASDLEVLVAGCLFQGNDVESGGYGGGLTVGYDCEAEIHDCTFFDNAADNGGALATYDARLSGCTVHANHGSYAGGVYLNYGATLTLERTIVSASSGGPAIGCASGSAVTAMTCCDVYDNAGGDYVGCIAAFAGINGNLSLDPLYCDAEAGDFGLLEDSPCLPFSPPNPECDLIGAWEPGCSSPQDVPSGSRPHARQLLGAPRPNPFRERTRLMLEFAAPAADPTLRAGVYDATGRLVAPLTIRSEPGTGAVVAWDGTHESGRPAAGGVYYVRVSGSGEASQRSVLLIR